MDKKELNQLNYLVNYINSSIKYNQYDDYFDQTIFVVSSALPCKVLYMLCNCPSYALLVKKVPELQEKVVNAINNATASELLQSFKYPAFRKFTPDITNIVAKKVLEAQSVDLNYFAEMLCDDPSHIGKIAYKKLKNEVDDELKIKLALNRPNLCGDYPSAEMYNQIADSAYIKNDFNLAHSLLEMQIKQMQSIKESGECLSAEDAKALDTLKGATNYLFSLMKNCIKLENYKQVLDLCELFSKADVNPNPYYGALLRIRPNKKQVNNYKDLLITLSKHTDLSEKAYNLLQSKFCDYIKDPVKYLNMFKQQFANFEILVTIYHKLTDIKNLKEYFDVTLQISKITDTCKNLQSQIFATCPYPNYIEEYIKTCKPEDLSYLASLQAHNRTLKKVINKTDILDELVNNSKTKC